MIQGSQQLTPNCGTAYVMPAGLRAISAVRFTRSRTSQDVRFTREDGYPKRAVSTPIRHSRICAVYQGKAWCLPGDVFG
jgi:hypothetical protein